MKVSVTIISRDKKNILPQCLESAKQISDDIVIVTNSDHKFVNFSDQKNYAMSLCKHDWIFSLDDDEWLSPELIKEIKSLPEQSEYSAYNIPRLNYIFGKAMNHTNWEPAADTHIWLWRKNMGKWVGVVHEELIISGKVQKLQGLKIHDSYHTVEEFVAKMTIVTSGEKKAVNPFYDFLRRYIWHAGFLDGWHGLFLSYLMFIYHTIVWVKLWQKKNLSLSVL